jgi:folate-dependent phosphoribosylglycinamide formyltransferase PurN
MELTKLYNESNGVMRVAGLMSGSGSNIVKILEFQRNYEAEFGDLPFEVVCLFSDNPNSNAQQIGKNFNLPVVIRDINEFNNSKNVSKKDSLNARPEFDQGTIEELSRYEATVAAYAGYMSIATVPLINAFLGINVHPADLSILDSKENRKYTGAHAVKDAILAEEKYLSSSTHIIEEKVDCGRILMVSSPIEVILENDFDPNNRKHVKSAENYNQERLKKQGDWIIFPKTLLYLAQGRFSKDKEDNLYFDGKRIPNGLRD